MIIGAHGDVVTGLTSSSYATRLAIMYGAIFSIYGAQLPFLSVWLEWRGISATGIGLIMACPSTVRLVANPLIAMWADRHGALTATIFTLSLVATAAAILLWASTHWVLIATAVTLMLVALQSAMPLIEAIAMRGVRALKLDYGRMRLWGSLTFIAATVGAGALIERAGISMLPAILLLCAIATTIAALWLPDRRELASAANAPSDEVARSTGAASLLDRDAIRAIFTDIPLVVFNVGVSLVQVTHAVYYAFSAIHWGRLGYSGEVIGALWAWGVIAEIVLFAYSARVIALVGANGLLLLGAVAGIVRWTAMAFDPGGGSLIFLQALHAFTFGATHLAAVHFISARVEERYAGTAQALFATLSSGIFMAAALFGAGLLYEAHGAGSYLAMAFIAAISIGAVVYTARTVGSDIGKRAAG